MKAALLLIVGVIIGVAAGGYGTLFAPAQPYHGLQPSSRLHVDRMVGDLFTRGAYQQ
jgi:hypothetical protein